VFLRQFFPVLTPLAIDPGHPFPHLSNKSLNLAVQLQRPGHSEKLLAFVQVRGAAAPRAATGDKGHVFTPLETVIRLHLGDLFPAWASTGQRLPRHPRQRVRDRRRRGGRPAQNHRGGGTQAPPRAAVRLEIESNDPPEVEQFLMSKLELESIDVYRIPGLLDLTGLFQIHAIPGYPHLRDQHFVPQQVPEFIQAADPWTAIRRQDILLHHPYESFAPVSISSRRRPTTTACWPSSRRSTAPVATRPSSVLCSVRRTTASRSRGHRIEGPARRGAEHCLGAGELEKAGVHVVYGFVGLEDALQGGAGGAPRG